MLTREVARRLALPEPVAEAIFELRDAWLHMPPASLLDTLLLANLYATVPSPLGRPPAPLPDHSDSALDYLVDEETLRDIIAEAAEISGAMGQALLA